MLIKWLHHLFNPHCEECRQERKCASCETYKMELEIERHEKRQLLNFVLIKPEPVINTPPTENPISVGRPPHIPWEAKRQILEENDRATARTMRERMEALVKPVAVKDIEDIEKELGVVENG